MISLHNMLPYELTKDTPYLALSGELWSVFYEYFNRNWPCYKGFLLYVWRGQCKAVFTFVFSCGMTWVCFVHFTGSDTTIWLNPCWWSKLWRISVNILYGILTELYQVKYKQSVVCELQSTSWTMCNLQNFDNSFQQPVSWNERHKIKAFNIIKSILVP